MKLISALRLIRKVMFVAVAPALIVALTYGGMPYFNLTNLTAEERLEEEGLETVLIAVEGITSDTDAAKIKSTLAKLPDVKGCNVDRKEGTIEVSVTKDADLDTIVEAIEGVGFEVVDMWYPEAKE